QVDNGGQIVPGRDVDIGAAGDLLQGVCEIHQSRWVYHAGSNYRSGSGRGSAGSARKWDRRAGVSGDADYLVFILQEVIDAEFFVVSQGQLADYRTQRHLRRADIHLVENLLNFNYNLPVT